MAAVATSAKRGQRRRAPGQRGVTASNEGSCRSPGRAAIGGAPFGAVIGGD